MTDTTPILNLIGDGKSVGEILSYCRLDPDLARAYLQFIDSPEVMELPQEMSVAMRLTWHGLHPDGSAEPQPYETLLQMADALDLTMEEVGAMTWSDLQRHRRRLQAELDAAESDLADYQDGMARWAAPTN